MKRIKLGLFLIIVILPIIQGCEHFLDEKADYSFSTPESLNDLRALLDNEVIINQGYPGLTEVGNTDYYLDDVELGNIASYLQDTYLWDSNDEATDPSSWVKPYEAIMVANVVLESINKVPVSDETLYRQVLGEAHFVRGMFMFYLSQLFCQPYDENLSTDQLGLPLKYTANIAEKIERSSLKKTYEQILLDLNTAKDHLPERSSYKTRATKSAAMAGLSRVYLSMAAYDKAERMTDSALLINKELLDYNKINDQIAFPFKADNPEIIYQAYSPWTSAILLSSGTFVSDQFYNAFEEDDLRKALFFTVNANGKISFKGYYTGFRTSFFAGLSVDELYLNKAELLARKGMLAGSLAVLNELRVKRYKSQSYKQLLVAGLNRNEVMNIVLDERRKQLFFRGVRWMDVRRLNKFDNRGIILRRTSAVTGVVKQYELKPNDLRFAYPIPKDVVLMSGLKQNPRQ